MTDFLQSPVLDGGCQGEKMCKRGHKGGLKWKMKTVSLYEARLERDNSIYR